MSLLHITHHTLHITHHYTGRLALEAPETFLQVTLGRIPAKWAASFSVVMAASTTFRFSGLHTCLHYSGSRNCPRCAKEK